MPAFNVLNTAGSIVATVNIGTTTGVAFPIEIVGQGITPYAPIIGQSQYRLLENFANATPPSNPVPGMFWYNSSQKFPHFYDGTQFVPLSTTRSSSSMLFNMLPAATSVDFTNLGSTVVFQAPGTSERYHPTGVMVVPNGTPSATTPATFNLSVGVSEDVMENAVVANLSATKHAFFNISGTTRFLVGSETLSVNVTSAATGGSLNVDIHVFGFVTG